jgi:ribosomal protein S18 acetylase RimI-like enzyme
MLSTRSLGPTSRSEIVDAFNDAFSQYEVPIDMNEAKLDFVIRERSVRLDHSFGLFDEDRLVGFVLNGSRLCDGILTGYDSGTGVRAAYQGKGYGRRLLQDTVSQLRELGYRRYLLEVLVENNPAISLYTSEGFEFVRKLHCYRTKRLIRDDFERTNVEINAAIDWEGENSGLLGYLPSWQNSDASVVSISDSCRILSASTNGKPEAFAVVIPEYGSIMQLGWKKEDALRRLLQHAFEVVSTDDLSIINLPESETETARVLTEVGFTRFISQFEMELDLSA